MSRVPTSIPRPSRPRSSALAPWVSSGRPPGATNAASAARTPSSSNRCPGDPALEGADGVDGGHVLVVDRLDQALVERAELEEAEQGPDGLGVERLALQ